MGGRGKSVRFSTIAGYDVVRIVLGLVLLAAAALKGHQLLTEPVLGSGLLHARWLLIGLVEFELFFGLWLLAGVLPKATWRLALACFTCFTAVSLFKALSGEASCGCFGRVPVNPWYTFTLDMAAVMALSYWRPNKGGAVVGGRVRSQSFRLGGVALASLLLGITLALTMGSHSAATLSSTGEILGDSEFVVLEPEQWIGKRFPLLEYIDIGSEISCENCILLLYHYDCANCQEAIEKYEALSLELAVESERSRVALIEMPPYGPAGDSSTTRNTPCMRGRLDAGKEWFVETPLVLHLREGKVSSVSEG
ncbi:MAG: hypothetical protein HQ582_27920 [Planctomycetes bacterium]|nr:hypothetical protein [Planctomycetota bacterium]